MTEPNERNPQESANQTDPSEATKDLPAPTGAAAGHQPEDTMNAEQYEAYQKHYSDESFWDKVTHYAKKAGIEVIEKALWLYYAVQKPEVPTRIKAIIYGALGYFILPLDVIADVIPAVGYTDDLLALAAAITLATMYIDEEVKAKARAKLEEWFGE